MACFGQICRQTSQPRQDSSRIPRALAKTEKRFEGYYSKKPHYVEAPPAMFWEDLARVTLEMKNHYPEYVEALSGMNIAVQRDIATIVDEKGEGLRDFISWMDRGSL